MSIKPSDAPSLAKSKALAFPIPAEAPVMIAILPSSLFMEYSFFLREIMNASCYKPMEAIGKSIDGSFIEQECIESQKSIILEN